jgi:hypothetical protein
VRPTAVRKRSRIGRTALACPGTVRNATELDWRGVCADFPPLYYGVEKGFVIDVDGNMSQLRK